MNVTEEVKKQKNRHVRIAIDHLTKRRDDLKAKIAVLASEVSEIDESLKKLE